MPQKNSVKTIIEGKLRESFSPSYLYVEDQSAQHAGHSGAHPQGESHFYVKIVSDCFRGLSKVRRHQLVYACLSEELKGRVHALSLSLLVPEELVESREQR